jgi:hypothetical protein
MRQRLELVMFAAAACCLPACNWLTPIIFIGEHEKRILPEFDKLPGKRVAVLIWVDPATQFDYPHARLELATYLSDKLSYEMEQRELGTELVDARDVEDFLERDLDARIDPQRVARRFDADYVIYVEILSFQIRDPNVPQFLLGRLAGSVTVHDTREDTGLQEDYELTPVEAVYPPSGPVVMTSSNAPMVREGLYRTFAEVVARKFYEHTVEL